MIDAAVLVAFRYSSPEPKQTLKTAMVKGGEISEEEQPLRGGKCNEGIPNIDRSRRAEGDGVEKSVECRQKYVWRGGTGNFHLLPEPMDKWNGIKGRAPVLSQNMIF